ncbi:MAG: ATP-dependent DNA helicase RecG [Vicinamibacterales bacterium]
MTSRAEGAGVPAGDSFLATPLSSLRGIGPRRASDLERHGLLSVGDLLSRFPVRYEDRGNFLPIARLRSGDTVSIIGTVVDCGVRLTRRRGFRLFRAVVGDGSGLATATWLNQPYLADAIRRGHRLVLYGKVAGDSPSGGPGLTNPDYEIVDADAWGVHTGRIVPVYEKMGSLTGKMQRRLVHDLLERLPPDLSDPLPPSVLEEMGYPNRAAALAGAHFPEAGTDVDRLNLFRAPAQARLIFEEFFLFQLGLLLRRRQAGAEAKPYIPIVNERVRRAARVALPFRLTPGQRTVVGEIVADMKRSSPMNRLLQGDVGSGKTVVALLAGIVAMENGLQVAVMAPTEILAEQHAETFRRLLAGSRFRVELLTGATPASSRRSILAATCSGDANLVVGTHALLQPEVAFARLGLAIIDEQHRFGVLARASLRHKGLKPDVLVMTATPIPRTLALTLYGDLDVSVLRGLPPGRQPVRTTVRPEARREEVYDFVRREVDAGRQAYIVYPLVEESSKVDLRAAVRMADHLAQDVFPAHRVGLLHGRMAGEARVGLMRAFAGGEVDILVATTVVEVGVDVPNASVIVIEHAERFGLSQLHQMRGRVGRGAHQASCILLYQSPLTPEAQRRLEAIAATNDGFVIAEKDLELRGAGDLFGTRQAGVPAFRVGDLGRDSDLMEEARRRALAWLDAGGAELDAEAWAGSRWAERFGLVEVG